MLLLLGLAIALGFEVVNGFHDTANAVATVIYTKSLKPWAAVIWSGVWNFLGVLVGGIAVAMAIVHLLPIDLLVAGNTADGLAAVMALLIGAVLWNLGTWYLGLPASSSHTLIGAILGVGVANSLLPGHVFGAGVNWTKAGDIGLALIVSPLVGFGLAYGLLWLSKKLIKRAELYWPADEHTPPPSWIRWILILTCTGVSFAHGSNDGQKGVGLIMLVLMGFLPAQYALNQHYQPDQMRQTAAAAAQLTTTLQTVRVGASVPESGVAHAAPTDVEPAELVLSDEMRTDLATIQSALDGRTSVKQIPDSLRWQVRRSILRVDKAVSTLEGQGLPADQVAQLKSLRGQLRNITDYAPRWVLFAVALALGLGTMVGWKRIVVTVGEKIGLQKLSYAQGASAEIVAAATIGLSSAFGLPVSTTHVLASGVTGTMVANRTGIQASTVRNIALAWLFTLPAAMLLAGLLFLLLRLVL